MTIEAALVVRQRVNKGFLNRFTSMQQEEFYLYQSISSSTLLFFLRQDRIWLSLCRYPLSLPQAIGSSCLGTKSHRCHETSWVPHLNDNFHSIAVSSRFVASKRSGIAFKPRKKLGVSSDLATQDRYILITHLWSRSLGHKIDSAVSSNPMVLFFVCSKTDPPKRCWSVCLSKGFVNSYFHTVLKVGELIQKDNMTIC